MELLSLDESPSRKPGGWLVPIFLTLLAMGATFGAYRWFFSAGETWRTLDVAGATIEMPGEAIESKLASGVAGIGDGSEWTAIGPFRNMRTIAPKRQGSARNSDAITVKFAVRNLDSARLLGWNAEQLTTNLASGFLRDIQGERVQDSPATFTLAGRTYDGVQTQYRIGERLGVLRVFVPEGKDRAKAYLLSVEGPDVHPLATATVRFFGSFTPRE